MQGVVGLYNSCCIALGERVWLIGRATSFRCTLTKLPIQPEREVSGESLILRGVTQSYDTGFWSTPSLVYACGTAYYLQRWKPSHKAGLRATEDRNANSVSVNSQPQSTLTPQPRH